MELTLEERVAALERKLLAREAAEEIASKTGADVVQVIGSRFVLFKRNHKEPVIEIKL